jgi:hypothetical protein
LMWRRSELEQQGQVFIFLKGKFYRLADQIDLKRITKMVQA